MQAAPRSSMARAGEVLLLVGAILRTVSAAFLMVLALAIIIAAASTREVGVAPLGFGFMGVIYLMLALLLLVSAVVAWVAWRGARDGRFRTPGVMGIVASMLPPVDVVLLLGGIFLLVSDEAQNEPRAPPRAPHWDEMVIRQDDPPA